MIEFAVTYLSEWRHSTEVFGHNVSGDNLNRWFEILECSKYWKESKILVNSTITAVIWQINNWCDIQLRLYQNNYIANILTGYCLMNNWDYDDKIWWIYTWCGLICFSVIFGITEWELKSWLTELWYSDIYELDPYRRCVVHTIVITMNICNNRLDSFLHFLLFVIQGVSADIVIKLGRYVIDWLNNLCTLVYLC